MKQKRIIIALFLCFAFLGLGIGYAALTDTLKVSGDLGANINNDNLVIVFDGETENSDVVSTVDGVHCNFATTAGAAGIDGRTTIELTVSGLTTKGDQATATLIVENRSIEDESLTATLSDPSVNYGDLDQELFEITAEWVEDDLTIASGEYKTINITITLKTTPTASVDAKAFEVTFTAVTA